MTPDEIYALRTTNLLSVPSSVLDTIAAMQLSPVAPVYTKKPVYKKPHHHHGGHGGHGSRHSDALSWRVAALSQLKKTEIVHDDPDYEAVLAVTNRVATSTIMEGVAEVLTVLQKRADDQVFRLRIVTLLFNRGVSMPFYSKLMANMFELLFKDVPAIKEDLVFSCSIDTFNKMFDQNDTLVCPSVDDPEYDDKLCAWSKKKELRRGFGMFVTELHIRGMVDEDVIDTAIRTSVDELGELIVKPTSAALSETVDHIVTFLFEAAKVVASRFGKEHPLIKMLAAKGVEIYKTPKTSTPCLGMRSRFKLDDLSRL